MRISIEELIIWFSMRLGQFNWLLQLQPNYKYNYVYAWNLSPDLLIHIILHKCKTCS